MRLFELIGFLVTAYAAVLFLVGLLLIILHLGALWRQRHAAKSSERIEPPAKIVSYDQYRRIRDLELGHLMSRRRDGW